MHFSMMCLCMRDATKWFLILRINVIFITIRYLRTIMATFTSVKEQCFWVLVHFFYICIRVRQTPVFARNTYISLSYADCVSVHANVCVFFMHANTLHLAPIYVMQLSPKYSHLYLF